MKRYGKGPEEMRKAQGHLREKEDGKEMRWRLHLPGSSKR